MEDGFFVILCLLVLCFLIGMCSGIATTTDSCKATCEQDGYDYHTVDSRYVCHCLQLAPADAVGG